MALPEANPLLTYQLDKHLQQHSFMYFQIFNGITQNAVEGAICEMKVNSPRV